MTPLLSVKNLNVCFKQRKKTTYAVKDVSFDVYPNDVIGIVGESGCGKSVMVKSILKLFNGPNACISKGEVLYRGLDLLHLSEKKLQNIRGKDISIIFQDPMTSLNPTMKIGHQIIEGLIRHFPQITRRNAVEKGLHLLNSVGISEPEIRFNQYPHELSGGMRQRIMIAIALAPSPTILIADEPTTALDVTIQAQILQLLQDLQKRTQTSILFITHDLSIVANLCTKVIVMYAGQIIETADVNDLFYSPKHPYTKKLLKSIPRLDKSSHQKLDPIEGRPPDLTQFVKGCGFLPRCEKALKICHEKNPDLLEVQTNHMARCWYYDKNCHLSMEDK